MPFYQLSAPYSRRIIESQKKRMSWKKSAPGRVATAFPHPTWPGSNDKTRHYLPEIQ
jgi:hypothetical protein